MNPFNEFQTARGQAQTRRHFLGNTGYGLGAIALNALFPGKGHAATEAPVDNPMRALIPMIAPKAKRVIYLHMEGAPPQQELFDFKPKLNEFHMKECPAELLEGKSFAFIKGTPKLLGSIYKFNKHGKSGAEISEMLPNIAKHADDLCIVKSMHTDQFNHAPAQLLMHTGSQQFGGASIGSWVTYGLGSFNEDLPGYMVLLSGDSLPSGGKSLWGSSFLPSVYQGVQCRSEGDPVLYVSNPEGLSRDIRRRSLDALNELNRKELEQFKDPETLTRINQYELAFRMQAAVPGVMDISKEPASILEEYGAQPGKASFANNCLLARRLVEKGVRFVQLFDWGWDIHGTTDNDDLKTQFPKKCKQTDQPVGALLTDLKRRGLLEDTLVIWGGEFGRTPMNEGRNGSKLLGRDHHPDAFTIWMAGAGVKPGTYGETDELGYSVVKDGVHVRDFHATILHACGLDPFKLNYPYQGLNQRLIGPANTPKVKHDLFA
ncbi:DUF1501 domain-containing protein [Luteolibacter algae]|uniref:DUF1501 domain-containing protein n=1 Tax=Luteolibacter algae TaxID=454151 RepID=A0ABW5D4L9_9BACT